MDNCCIQCPHLETGCNPFQLDRKRICPRYGREEEYDCNGYHCNDPEWKNDEEEENI